MDELRESSLLFSLASLLETERERVQRETREAQRRREEELQRVTELGERRRVATKHEREARERRAVLEQDRERLEQERIEAMKRATVERARIEAEGQLRIVELEQARKHDLALARIREDERSAQHRTVSWLSTGALAVVMVVTAGGFFGLIQPAHARQEQHLRTLVSVAEERASQSARALADERSKNLELLQRVNRLEQQAIQLKSAASKLAQPPAHSGPTRTPGSTSGSIPPRIENCADDGDPLSKCLGRKR